MRRLFAVSLLSALVASSAAAAPTPKESWGKLGISLETYRQDALDCGLQGYYTDISKTDDAQAFVKASKQLDAVTTGGMAPMTTGSSGIGPKTTGTIDQAARYADQQEHIIQGIRPEERFKNIKTMLVANTQQCLQKRGYSKFELTEDQQKRLRKLKAGSDERRAYLYTLATHPAVLENQKAAGQP